MPPNGICGIYFSGLTKHTNHMIATHINHMISQIMAEGSTFFRYPGALFDGKQVTFRQ